MPIWTRASATPDARSRIGGGMATSGASVVGLPTPAPLSAREQRSPLATALRALGRDWITLAAAVFLIVVVLAAIFADLLVQVGLLRDPSTQSLLVRNSPPGVARNGQLYLLGTDQLGRD